MDRADTVINRTYIHLSLTEQSEVTGSLDHMFLSCEQSFLTGPTLLEAVNHGINLFQSAGKLQSNH